VRVLYGEGIANHTGPESWVSGREAWDEALTGEQVGQPLSYVTKHVRSADAVRVAAGNTSRCAIASACPAPRSLRPWRACETSGTGTERSHAWPPEGGWSAPGRPEGRSR